MNSWKERMWKAAVERCSAKTGAISITKKLQKSTLNFNKIFENATKGV